MSEGEPVLPSGLEYVNPDIPELGFRLIGKLSITDGVPVPEVDTTKPNDTLPEEA